MPKPIAASSLAFHPRSPEEVIRWAAQAGFSGVEILCEPPWHPGGWGGDRRSRVRRLAQAEKLALSLHAPIADVNLMSPHPQVRRLAAEELVHTLELARELGATHVTFHLGYRPTSGLPGTPPWEEVQENLREVAQLARSWGVKLCLENDPPGPGAYLAQLPAWLGLLEEIGLPGTLDVGHAWLTHGVDLLKIIPGQVEVVHLHDNRGQGDEHLRLGEGNIPWKKLLHQLGEVELWVLEVKDQEGLHTSLSNVQKVLRGA